MDSRPTLSGLRILVTRPAAQAELVCRLLAARGADVQRLPLQVIEPARTPAVAKRLFETHRDAHAWIFTSTNAVKFAAELDPGVWPPCIAVGAATAAALQALGQSPAVPVSAYSSDGVLALPELQDVAGHRYLVVAGEHGLDRIHDGLVARGAVVSKAAVYRRVALPHPQEAVAQALDQVQAAVVTSGEALQRLHLLTTDATRPSLLRTQLVVPSQRVVEQAQQLGFLRVPLVPDPITDAAYVQCLEHWWAEAAPRDPA